MKFKSLPRNPNKRLWLARDITFNVQNEPKVSFHEDRKQWASVLFITMS
ncbi:hypothetical protein [Oceanobacillus chungangensis]|nr:hypothetical protein [Oceanobacillus chungangensis]